VWKRRGGTEGGRGEAAWGGGWDGRCGEGSGDEGGMNG